MSHQTETPITLLDLDEVSEITGYSRSAIYLKMERGEFPVPLKMGARRVRWKLSDINEWIEQRPRAEVGSGDQETGQ